MKLNRFGTVLTTAEYRSLCWWLACALLGAVAIVGTIGYYELQVWFNVQNVQQRIAGIPSVKEKLAAALEEKGALKKELELLSKQHGDLARIRQQQLNPYRLLHELQTIMHANMRLVALAGEHDHIQVTLQCADRASCDQFLQQLPTLAATQPLQLQSFEVLANGVIQIVLTGLL